MSKKISTSINSGLDSTKIHYTYKKGKKQNCFFILPSIVMTNYKQNTWLSETKYITIGFLRYFFEITITKFTKAIDYTITDELIQSIIKICNAKGYHINDIELLKIWLKENKNLILLLKNTNLNHVYLQKTLINIIQYQSFVKQGVKIKNEE